MEVQKLLDGTKGIVHVVGVQENFDSYANRKTEHAETVYCHKVFFKLDEDEEFTGQICSNTNTVGFIAGDAIEITIKKFTRGIYTLGLDRIIPGKHGIDSTEKESLPSSRIPVSMYTGTAGELALRYSTTYHANRMGSTIADIIRDADLFREYILTHASK